MSNTILSGTVPNFTTAGDDWYTVTFNPAFPKEAKVIVNAQIQTYNGVDTPGLRLQKVSNTGFQVCMKEVHESNTSSSKLGDLGTVKGNGKHQNAETLGWIAISS